MDSPGFPSIFAWGTRASASMVGDGGMVNSTAAVHQGVVILGSVLPVSTGKREVVQDHYTPSGSGAWPGSRRVRRVDESCIQCRALLGFGKSCVATVVLPGRFRV